MTNKQFGKNISTLRTTKGITQAELAEKSGLHRTFISSVEKGQRNITLETLAKLAEGLNVQINDLFISSNNNLSSHVEAKEVAFIKLGGTWDMVMTEQGLQGSGNLDDQALESLEKRNNYDEKGIVQSLEKEFQNTEPINKNLASHLYWVSDISKFIKGKFYPLFSGDSSHYRPALLSAVIAYLLKRMNDFPNEQIIIGMGTDTTDILLPLLDVFLFDQQVLPILVSGANRSHREKYSDAPQNFTDLAMVTHMSLLPGAYYVFNKTIYKGGDIVKTDPNEEPTSLEGMITFFSPQRTQSKLGFLNVESRKEGLKVQTLPYKSSALDIFQAMNEIVTVDLGDVNSTEHEINKILDPSFKGIIIESHALGNTSQPIKRAVIKAIKEGKLVLNVSRCLMGNVNDRYYASLLNLNNGELKDLKNKVINGGKLNNRAAKAILVRSLLEKRSAIQTQELVNEYLKRVA